MIRDHRATLRSDESGLTLVEVLIYSALAVVVATIVTSMFIGTVRGGEQVTSTTTATTRGQTVAQGIERALRNATAVSVSVDGQTIKVLTTLNDECQAWRLNGGNLQIASNNALTSWKTFATGVTPASGSAAFGYDSTTKAYTYSLAFESDTQPIEFTGGIVPRGTGGDLGGTCS